MRKIGEGKTGLRTWKCESSDAASDVLTYEKLKMTELFQLVLLQANDQYDKKTRSLFDNFHRRIEDIIEEHSTDAFPAAMLKEVALKRFPKSLKPAKLEVQEEKLDFNLNLHTPPWPLDAADVGTEEKETFGNDIVSQMSEENLNEAVLIQETTMQLEELAVNESLDLNTALASSTLIKQNIVEKPDSIIAQKVTHKLDDSALQNIVLTMKEHKRDVGTPLIHPSKLAHCRNLLAQRESRSIRPVLAGLTPRHQNRVVSTKKTECNTIHADELRQKFLNLKKDSKIEKIERKRLQEEVKFETRKSPNISFKSQHHPLKRIRTENPSNKCEEQKPLRPDTTLNSQKLKKNTGNSHKITPSTNNNKAAECDLGNKSNFESPEREPRKQFPVWAHTELVKRNVLKQLNDPRFDAEKFFGPIEKVNLKKVFGDDILVKKRGSSAIWK